MDSSSTSLSQDAGEKINVLSERRENNSLAINMLSERRTNTNPAINILSDRRESSSPNINMLSESPTLNMLSETHVNVSPTLNDGHTKASPMTNTIAKSSENSSSSLNTSSSYQSRLDVLKQTARTISSPTLPLSSIDRNVKNVASTERSNGIRNFTQVVHEKKVTVKPACDFNGSLLTLAAKLHEAEFTVHRRHTNPSPPRSLNQLKNNARLCVSHCLGTNGFGFKGIKGRKRAFDEEDKGSSDRVDDEINFKRHCMREETQIGNNAAVRQTKDLFDQEQINRREILATDCMDSQVDRSISKVSLGSGSVFKTFEGTRSTRGYASAEDAFPSDEFLEQSVGVLKQLYVTMKQAIPDQFDAIPELPWVRGPALWPILSSARVADDVDICAYHDRNVESFREQNHRFRHRIDRYTSMLTDEQNELVVEMGVANAIFSQRSVLANCVVATLRRLNLAGMCAANVPPNDASSNSCNLSTKDHSGLSLSASLRRFVCDRCPYHTDNKSHLVRHKNSIHLTHRPFPCYMCLKPFSRAENVRAHFRSAHPLSTFFPELVKMVKVDDVDPRSTNSPCLSDTKMDYSTMSDGEMNTSSPSDRPRQLDLTDDRERDSMDHLVDYPTTSRLHHLPTFSNKKWSEAHSDREQDSINRVILNNSSALREKLTNKTTWNEFNGGRSSKQADSQPAIVRGLVLGDDGKPTWIDYPPVNGNILASSGKNKHSKAAANALLDSDEQPYCCELCSMRFATIKLLEVHCVTAHRRRLFVCRNCDFYFTFDAAEYHTHRACIHGEVVGGESMATDSRDWAAQGRTSAALLSMLTQQNSSKDAGKNPAAGNHASTNGALDLSSNVGTLSNNATDMNVTDLNSEDYSNLQVCGIFLNNSANRILPFAADNNSKNYGKSESGRASSDIDANRNLSNNAVLQPQRNLQCKPMQMNTPKRELPTSANNSSEDGSSLTASRTNSPALARKLLLDGLSRYQNSSPAGGGAGIPGGSENPLFVDQRRRGNASQSASGKKDIIPRSNKTFFCPLCPERDPFRYHKSFDKHMRQHAAGVAAAPPAAMSYMSAQMGRDMGKNKQTGVVTHAAVSHHAAVTHHAAVPQASKRPFVPQPMNNTITCDDENSFDSDESDVLAYHDDPNDRDYK